MSAPGRREPCAQVGPRPSRNEWAIQGELARILASSRTSTRRITTRVSAWLVARYKLSGSLVLATLSDEERPLTCVAPYGNKGPQCDLQGPQGIERYRPLQVRGLRSEASFSRAALSVDDVQPHLFAGSRSTLVA